MSQKFRLSQLRLKSDTADRSWLVTENMTSATPDKAVGTTFKNVLVNETWEVVVWSWTSVSVTTPSVTWNTWWDFTSISMRWENDTGTLNTATTWVAQKVMQQTSVASWVATITTIVEEYVDNTLYVDLTYWNNATGLRERADRPFSTVAAAVTASISWDTIVLRNGSYAIGTITLPHSLNFQCDEWVSITTISLIVWAFNVNRQWWNILKSTNITPFVLNTWANVSCRCNNIVMTSTWVNFVWLNNGNTGSQFYLEFNTVDTTACTTWWVVWMWDASWSTVIIKWKRRNWFTWFVVNAAWATASNNKFTWDIDHIESTTARELFRFNWNEWNNIINIKWKYLSFLWNIACVRTPFWAYWNKIYFDFERSIFTNIAIRLWWEWNEAFVSWKEAEAIQSPLYVVDSPGTINAVTWTSRTNIITCDVQKVWQSLNTSDTNWLWYWYPNAWCFAINMWWTLNIRCIEAYALKNEVIWVDSAWIVPHLNKSIINIYGTKISRLWKDAWLWEDWVIHIDSWSANHPDYEVNFYNWVVVENYWDNFIIWRTNWAPSTTQVKINKYDNVVTIWSWWLWLQDCNYIQWETVNYLYQPTKTITAPWTYTVLDNENDLYYDLTLGNMTLVLPDPAKFVNREIQIKVTALHPTNLITIDPVWAALIDWAATYVIPWTSTKLVNIVFKSQNWAWRIK
jgi:hypothetical protein